MKQNKEIPQGYKDSPLGVIPENWEVKRLGDVYGQISSFSFSRKQMTNQRQELRYIHYGDIHTDIEKDSVNLTKEELPFIFDGLIPNKKLEVETFPLLRNGDVLLADASEDYEGVGKSWELLDIANEKVVAGLHTIVLRDKEKHFFIGFGKYIFRNPKSSKQLKRIAQGTKVYSISYNHISKLNILIPSLPEQQKIAEILTCWDTAIEKQTQLIEKLEARKRGIMQQLLTGKKRLEEFKITKWNKVTLNQCISHTPREVLKPESPFFALGIRSHGKGIFHKNDFEPDNLSMNILYEVKENDLIVNITFAWEHAIAIADTDDDGGLVSHRFPTYTFKTKTAIPKFFKYYILQKRFKHNLELISPGGAGRNRVMSKNDFLKIIVSIPKAEEQIALANILSTADKEIQKEKEKLAALKSQKKGLMQVLLTGKKRVKI